MTRLSVNVNKVATVRNSRGGSVPSVLAAVRASIAAGAPSITVHPRGDERHITRADVREIAAWLASEHPGVEFNIEGDPRPDWMELVLEQRPTQATLVPVRPGEITSEAGFDPRVDSGVVAPAVKRLKAEGIRVSLFVDPVLAPITWARDMGADRVELYTEPFAKAFAAGGGEGARSFEGYVRAAEHAHSLGLGLNAGHDLDLDNLVLFRTLPHLDEVSIGHALIGRALFYGLENVVREYLACLAI
ncbi:MAG TPA: pyridoxine 5'-phosphate synthase [Polyangiales bacterium]|nr:pyridoxine 5'-phosphate synthase [Polyangiales bacterium]